MAKLFDEEKMAVVGLCNGSMLLMVYTPCTLGNDGKKVILTWQNKHVNVDCPNLHSGTGRCNVYHGVHDKNQTETVQQRYLKQCMDNAVLRTGEPVDLFQEAFD